MGNELHEIGMRMVADFFELDGWDTYYLGANTAPENILEALALNNADVLAVSVTMVAHLSLLENVIKAVRAVNSAVKILTGGYPFNIDPNLWRKIGADGFARDAESAISVANRLLENNI